MKKSLYDVQLEQGEKLLDRGFDYQKQIFKRSVSRYFFTNSTLTKYIEYLNDIFFEYIEAVKKIRIFDNFTVDKDYRKIQ